MCESPPFSSISRWATVWAKSLSTDLSRCADLPVETKVATEQGVRGTVTQVPYPTRSDAESAMPPVKPKDERAEAAAVSLDAEDEKAKEKARKVRVFFFLWCAASVSSLKIFKIRGIHGADSYPSACLRCPCLALYRSLHIGPPSMLSYLCCRLLFVSWYGCSHQAAKLEAMQKKLDALKARRKATP